MERVNSDRVGWAPAPATPNANAQEGLEATSEDLAEKNREGESWLVENVVDHRRTSDDYLQLRSSGKMTTTPYGNPARISRKNASHATSDGVETPIDSVPRPSDGSRYEKS